MHHEQNEDDFIKLPFLQALNQHFHHGGSHAFVAGGADEMPPPGIFLDPPQEPEGLLLPSRLVFPPDYGNFVFVHKKFTLLFSVFLRVFIYFY